MMLVVGCGVVEEYPEVPKVEEAPIGEENSIAEERPTETFEYSFVDVVELSFKPVELAELEEGKPLDSWELIKSIPLGEMHKKEVTLHIYRETDSNNICSSYGKTALLEYDGKTYVINECVSDSLLSENVWEYQAAYLLPHTFVSDDGQILHATIELFANGPGQMLYIFYDRFNGRWLTFWDWGYPILVDLDSSGDVKLVNQFAGLHMHWPDATIYRWNNDILESSISLKYVLGIGDQGWNEVSLEEAGEGATFHALAVIDQNQQLYETATYRYEDGNLFKID